MRWRGISSDAKPTTRRPELADLRGVRAELKKESKTAAGLVEEFRYRFMEADSRARELEKERKTAATRATAAEQRAGEAERVAAELRGKLDALKGDKQ